jgi:hypothetical protein
VPVWWCEAKKAFFSKKPFFRRVASGAFLKGKTVQTLHKIKKLPPWTALKLKSNPAPHLTIAVLTPHQTKAGTIQMPH